MFQIGLRPTGWTFKEAGSKIKLPPGEKVDNAALVESLGGEEYEQASDGDRLYIVRYWCQTMMRSRY